MKKRSSQKILHLLDDAEDELKREKSLIVLDRIANDGSIIIVGDTHGDNESSKLVLENVNLKKDVAMFLGDYVDRGERELENIIYLLTMKLLYPDKVYLLRGNHESPIVNDKYGFFISLSKYFPQDCMHLFIRFNEIFSLLPYGVFIDDYMLLLLHGGLTRNMEKVEEIKRLPRKDLIPSNRMAFEILWNDPEENVRGFIKSTRGENTYFFGRDIVENFLSENDLSGIIREHQYIGEGYKFSMGRGDVKNYMRNFEGYVLTLFTCRYHSVNPAVAVLKNREISIRYLMEV
ncbi:MAG TPA: serine/threonine protein phosphatase [Candidatus Bathyarchaeota archaeon]|nr:serine/threonine protein phosphatase [Candidatus Bathyarchaeota archaeon]